MNASVSCGVLLLALGVSACSSDDANPGSGGSSGSSGSSAAGNNSAGATSAAGNNAGGTSSSAGTSSGGGGSGTAGGPTTPPGSTAEPTPLISLDVPAFASSSEGMPGAANDRKKDTRWVATALPAWLAYDLSGAPAAQREQVLVAWYGPLAADFINPTPDASKRLPMNYTLEVNDAPGGGDAPAEGWEVVATVNDNNRNARQRLVDMAGTNWIRINVTKGAAPDAVAIDMDVHAAPEGATDSWLLMGDSITFMSTTYVFSNLPELISQREAGRYPAIIPAAIGGTNTTTAMDALDDTIADYPGRFVGLAYGTNDNVPEFKMDALVQKVIAAGKTPVVPRMPWSDTAATKEKGPQINAIIDGLYEKYPEILRGPDLWQAFLDHPELFPPGDIHPNEAGQEVLRKAWAAVIAP